MYSTMQELTVQRLVMQSGVYIKMLLSPFKHGTDESHNMISLSTLTSRKYVLT